MDYEELALITPHRKPWFFTQYWNNGTNNRFLSFQLALNLLNKKKCPVIVETGCQREENDFGAGMSTLIFAEYVYRYGGKFIVVDNVQDHLNRARGYVEKKWPVLLSSKAVEFVLSDSVEYLQNHEGDIDLVYLDSYDYPYVEMLNRIGRKHDASNQPEIEANLWKMSKNEIFQRFNDIIIPCQQHCLNEFLGVERCIPTDGLLLVDDVYMPGDGKPGMLMKHLQLHKDFEHIYTYQQTLWRRS